MILLEYLKKLNAMKYQWSIFKVFFALKTMPLTGFRWHLTILSSEHYAFTYIQMKQPDVSSLYLEQEGGG